MATTTSQLIEQRLPDNEDEQITPEDVRLVLHALEQQVPNERRGGPFSVVYLTHALAVADGRPYLASLDQLDPALLCLGSQVRVDIYPGHGGQVLILIYDGRDDPGDGLRCYVDGTFSDYPGSPDGRIPGKWVPIESEQAASANVPLYVPGKSYAAGYLVRYTLAGGPESFFYARKAGQLPAPTAATDGNWKVVPGPVAATALWQAVSLAVAQGMAGESVQAGRLYQINFGPDAHGVHQLVYVRGLDQQFDVLGTLELDGVRTSVQVDVAAGIFKAVASDALSRTVSDPQVVAGPVTFKSAVSAPDFSLLGTDVLSALDSLYKISKAVEQGQESFADFGDMVDNLQKSVAGLLNGAPEELNTFLEAYQHWQATKNAADSQMGLITALQNRASATEKVDTQQNADVDSLFNQVGDIYQTQLPLKMNIPALFGNLSGRVLFVQGYGQAGGVGAFQSPGGQRGNITFPYPTMQTAINSARDGDTIIVFPGGTGTDSLGRPCYTEAFYTNGKALNFFAVGEVIIGAGVVIGTKFGGGIAKDALRTVFKNFNFGAYFAVISNTGGSQLLLMEDCRFENGGFFTVHGQGNGGTDTLDKYYLTRCTIDANGNQGDNNGIVISSRDDAGRNQPVNIYLRDTRVTAKYDAPIGRNASTTTKIVLRGSTTLVPTNGVISNTTQGTSSTKYADADLFIDERNANANAGTGFQPTTTGDGTKYLNDKGVYAPPPTTGSAAVATATTPGTVKPGNRLSVQADGTLDVANAPAADIDLGGHHLFSSTTGVVYALGKFWVDGTGQRDVLYFKGGPGGAGSTAGIAFDATGTNFGTNVSARLSFVDDGAYGAHFVWETKASAATNTDTNEKMRLTTAGNLGLGLTAPPERLSANGRLYLAEQGEPPTPTNGGVQWVQNGALWYKGSSGTKTMLGAA